MLLWVERLGYDEFGFAQETQIQRLGESGSTFEEDLEHIREYALMLVNRKSRPHRRSNGILFPVSRSTVLEHAFVDFACVPNGHSYLSLFHV